MEIKYTIKVGGMISPTDTLDEYPTHEDIYGKGGFMTVSSIADRDAIPLDRRKLGMMCAVSDGTTTLVYLLRTGLTNADWASGATSTEYMTYEQLKAKMDAGELISGATYAITDYECIYKLPHVTPVVEMRLPASDFLAIILTAVSNNRFSETVEVVRDANSVLIAEAKFEMNPENVEWTKGMQTHIPKGVFTYMKDYHNNECSYDFKHVKFRRYAILDITANMDPDNGTGRPGPYKVNTTVDHYKFNDERLRTGAGEASELITIPATFNGTWRRSTTDLESNPGLGVLIQPYHEEYKIRAIKPYLNTEYPHDKYLAWLTDMYAVAGISMEADRGNGVKLTGLCHVEVDPADYLDRYTFDYKGQDASDMDRVGSTGGRPLVDACTITYDRYSKGYVLLPNIVIAFSESGISNKETCIYDVKIIGNCTRNTILLRPTTTVSAYNYTTMYSCIFGHNGQFGGNLMITQWTYKTQIGAARSNYLNVDMGGCTIHNDIQRSALFGRFSAIDARDISQSLLWGSHWYLREEGGNWKVAPDGEYWYDVTINDWWGYNYMGPCMYAFFMPHFNTNTFRSLYNKGIRFSSNCQGSSYGWTAWGVNVEYGMGLGIKTGSIIRSNISALALRNITASSATTAELFDNTQIELPTIRNTDIYAYQINPGSIRTSLTASEITALNTLPAGSPRRVLCGSGLDTWHLCYYKPGGFDTASQTFGIQTLNAILEPESGDFDDDFRRQMQDMYPYEELLEPKPIETFGGDKI